MKHFTPYALLVVFGLASVIMITWLRLENRRLRSDIAGYELLIDGYQQLAELRRAADAAWIDYYTNNRIDAKLRNWQVTWPVVEPDVVLRDTIYMRDLEMLEYMKTHPDETVAVGDTIFIWHPVYDPEK